MAEASKKMPSSFLTLWFGQFISLIGSGLTTFSLGIHVFHQTQSAFYFSMIILCIFLPSFLIKPFGGILADRFDRRMMMIIGDLGASLGILFVFLLMHFSTLELWQIYLGVFISATFSAIQEPAYKASVTDLLPKEQFSKASGLMQLASSAQYLISPFLAGMLLLVLDVKFILIIDFVTFIIGVTTVLLVIKIIGKTEKKYKKQSLLFDFKEGVHEFRKNIGVTHLVVITSIVLFFVGMLQSLFLPMLLSFTNPTGAGISQSLCASGILVGSLIIGIYGYTKNHVAILATSLFFSGIFFAAIGVPTNIIYVTLAGFLFFSCLPFINTSIEVLIRSNIDNKVQGRVWSIISAVTYLGSIVAFMVSGIIADKIFNPLLEVDGGLSQTIGLITGVGESRGIGLIFMISGVMISLISLSICRLKSIRSLETNTQGIAG